MLVMFTASYLSFQQPDITLLYWTGAAGVLVGLFLLAVRWLERVRLRRLQQRSAWQTFRKLARSRGLTQRQVRALAIAARSGNLRRPAQIMGSLLVLDRCVESARAHDLLSQSQLEDLGDVRARLLAAPEDRGNEDRRHLQRANCTLSVDIVLVPPQDIGAADAEDPGAIRAKLEEVSQGFGTVRGTTQDLSAGGAALLVAAQPDIDEGWYVGIRAGGDGGELDLKGIWAEVLAVGGSTLEAACILHLRFLPYEIELKRQIIQLVYASSQGDPGAAQAPGKPPDAHAQRPSPNHPNKEGAPGGDEQRDENSHSG